MKMCFNIWLIVLLVVGFSAALSRGGLINGGFEIPDIGAGPTVSQELPGNVPGWDTTDMSIEIWANGFNGVFSYEGTQHAEINAFINGTLSQNVTGIALGERVGFEFAHRARVGTDVMSLTITDLGPDNVIGGGNDTVLFTSNFAATTAAWVFNTSASFSPIFALGNDIQFAYTAVSTGSGNPGVGNFLDAADFGIGVALAIPEPASLALICVTAMIMRRRRFHR